MCACLLSIYRSSKVVVQFVYGRGEKQQWGHEEKSKEAEYTLCTKQSNAEKGRS
jgi:hypothetical protein